MTAAAAAVRWLELRPKLKALKGEVAQTEEVLKAYFRTSGKARYRGVAYASSTYQALDVGLARAQLGSKATACEVERTRETLSPTSTGR